MRSSVLTPFSTRQHSFSQQLARFVINSLILHHILFVFGFVFFLQTASEVTQYRNAFFFADWWNTKWCAHFWTRWNVLVHLFFKRHVVWPLERRGHNTHAVKQLVFIISGLMHEYIVAFPLKQVNFLITLDFAVQYPFSLLQASLIRKLGIKNETVLFLGFYFHMFVICHALLFLYYYLVTF